MEPERELHQPWVELFDDSPCWKQLVKSSYDVYNSGGKVDSSNDHEPPYGVSILFLRNSMVRHAFEFMRLYIHCGF